MATTMAAKSTDPTTMPAMAPAAAEPHKLPSLGVEVQAVEGATGRSGANAKGAAPSDET